MSVSTSDTSTAFVERRAYLRGLAAKEAAALRSIQTALDGLPDRELVRTSMVRLALESVIREVRGG